MNFSRLFFLMALFSAGCADRNYAPSVKIDRPDEKVGTCQATFSSGLCVSMSWEKVPTESDFGAFTFQTLRANPEHNSASAEDPANSVAVVLWMPSMGHGSSPVFVEKLGIGSYRATQVFFTMRGDWEIRFQLKDQNGVHDQASIPLIF